MKRFLILLAFLCSMKNVAAQTDSMSYFIGKWKFSVWFAGNEKKKPDMEATWILEKSEGKNFEANGKVLMGKKGETTKEQMVFDTTRKLYSRTITSGDGLFFFTSSGWKGDKLIWEGHLVPLSDQHVQMKEEITLISENEFHALFYKKVKDEWVLVTKEVLKRVL